jgi:homoserine dehydrogenase
MDGSVGIGLLGAGTVGGSLIRRLVNERAAIAAKTGLDLGLVRVAVANPDKPREFDVPEGVLTTDAAAVVGDDRVELVVEVMGGRDPAGDLVLAALEAGKPVVTANKELVAVRGPELIAAAERSGVPLLFEAAVGGGIPIIRPLAETLAGEPIERVLGIVNGTTNFILTQMAEEGTDFEEALAEAQALGFAEPDPTADVSGADAAAKAAILSSLAFGAWVGIDDVYHEGIDTLSRVDMAFAADLGYTVKLLAIAERSKGGISARVHPVMLPSAHPLSAVRGPTNAIYIEGPSVGELLFAGPGAGGEPTATAVLGDVIDAAREMLAGAQVSPSIRFSPGELIDFGDTATKFYVRLAVDDRPGVLAQIAGAFGEADVSIKSVWQEGEGSEALLLIVTHRTSELQQRAAVSAVAELAPVREVSAVIRVESEEP